MTDLGKVGENNQAFESGNEKGLAIENFDDGKSEISNSSQKGQGQNETRQVWGNQIEFLFSCISMSVGLGNIWRFPFVALENGGGAFLIPYLIVLTLIGRPIYFLELLYGQFSSFGPVKAWEMSRIFRGIGYASILATFSILTYYSSIIAITIFFFIISFQKTLPWTECRNYTSEIKCINNSAVNMSNSNPELYYNYEVIKKYDHIDDGLGAPEWRMTLCLFAAWVFVFFSLIRGVQSSGKVAYFTAIFPYVVLIIMLIRGATLEGSGDGMIHFLKPEWSKLTDVKVWYEAVGQCFFSLGTGTGTIVMFSSYNPFRHNVYRDAIIVSIMDTFTSLLAGLSVFAVIGYLKHESGAEKFEDVVQSGPGLIFISYPEAIGKMDFVPQLFAVLFFLMLFTLGVGTTVPLTNAVITIISDNYPNIKKWQITVVVCASGFLCGLVYVTPGGQFILTLVSNFGGTNTLYIISLLEVVGIAWVYGLKNFKNDVEYMLGLKVGIYWNITWGFITPVGLVAIFLYATATTEELTHENTSYPSHIIVIGWLVYGFILAVIPIVALYEIFKLEGMSLSEKFRQSYKPTKDWRPKNADHYEDWVEFKKNKKETLTIWEKVPYLNKKIK